MFNEYANNICENKYSENISEVPFCEEQPKPNVDEGGVLFVLVLGIPSFLVVFAVMQHFPGEHISLSCVS